MKDKCFIFKTETDDKTLQAGRILAEIMKGVVFLEGNLGTGKTVVARGVAKGLGITEYITSPTFNIINIYESGTIPFNHMDAYRITDPEMLYDLGLDDIISSGSFTVIEWADMISDALDEPDARVRIEYGGEPGQRLIYLEGPGEMIEEFARRWT